MKVVILAGGLGTRLSEETYSKPKPMVEIGGRPILWHIMKHYSHFGLKEFIICCGYKGHLIKEFFLNYHSHISDFSIELNSNKKIIHSSLAENWKVTLIDTGDDTLTGGRIRRIKNYIGNDKDFCMTYGDGVSDIDIKKLIKFHKKNRKIATLTAVRPEGRFGSIDIKRNLVTNFKEKIIENSNYINGGFFVLKNDIFKFLKSDKDIFEEGPVQKLAKLKELAAYKHHGFWQPMDSLRDKNTLELLWKSKKSPWKIWI